MVKNIEDFGMLNVLYPPKVPLNCSGTCKYIRSVSDSERIPGSENLL